MLLLFKDSNFAETLKNTIETLESTKKSSLCKEMRRLFRVAFLNETKFEGLIGIYRCLLYSRENTNQSKTYCDAVNELWPKLFGSDKFTNLKPDDNVEDKAKAAEQCPRRDTVGDKVDQDLDSASQPTAHLVHIVLESLVKNFDAGQTKKYGFIIEKIEVNFSNLFLERITIFNQKVAS